MAAKEKDRIEVTRVNNHCFALSPYIDTFPPAARALGGEWRSADKVWVFPAQREGLVRQTMIRCYGTDNYDPAVYSGDRKNSPAVNLIVDMEKVCRGNDVYTLEIFNRLFVRADGGRNGTGSINYTDAFLMNGRLYLGAPGNLEAEPGTLVMCRNIPFLVALEYINGRGRYAWACRIATQESTPTDHAELNALPPDSAIMANAILEMPADKRRQLLTALSSVLKKGNPA